MPKLTGPSERQTPGSDAGRWAVRILGTVAVEGPDLRVDQFPTRRSALILIRLGMARGRAISRDELAGELWPDEFPDATKPRLRQELTRLRRALGEAAEIIASDRLSLRIDGSAAEIDLQGAERLILRCEFQEPAGELLSQAPGYARDLAPGYDEPWIVPAREDWRNRFSEVLLKLGRKRIETGSEDEGIDLCRRAAMFHLFSESVQVRYIRLLLKLGRAEEACAHVAELKRVYPQLLGTGPTRRLLDLVAPAASSVSVQSARIDARPLPAALSQMVGRSTELQLLKERLGPRSQVRLATLCGPGGIGKTHLALEAARGLYDAYGARVWFVTLASVTNPALIGHVLAESMGIQTINRDRVEAVCSALRGAPALLVLDNFEQLVDGGAQVVRSLLERCPDVKLLVTTRRTLNLEGEYELPLSPLPMVAAVDLFLSLSRAHRSPLDRTDEDLERVADIVRLLDRMPLAIHLAAARSGVLSLKDIEAQLAHRFDLLVSRRGDIVERHRTMRQTVAWSYDQLDSNLKRFFTDLAVFEGGWTAQMAADVLQEPTALELLEQLRENSFVTAEPVGDQMRFDMLVTLRDFARENEDPKRLAMHRERLCNAILELCSEASKRMLAFEQAWWYERLETEHGNIRSALTWASANHPEIGIKLCSQLWRFWSVCGHQVEARHWFETFLSEEVEPTESSSIAIFGAAMCATEQGDTRHAFDWFDRAYKAFTECGDLGGASLVDFNRGGVLLLQGKYQEARQLFEEVLQGRFVKGRYSEGLCRDDLAVALMGLGRLSEAEEELRKAKLLLSEHPDRIAQAYCELNMGRLLRRLGRLDEARDLLLSALEVHRQFGNHHGVGLAYEILALAALDAGRLGEVELMLEESSQARSLIADSLGTARLVKIRSELERARGGRERSDELLVEAARLFTVCGCFDLAEACIAGPHAIAS